MTPTRWSRHLLRALVIAVLLIIASPGLSHGQEGLVMLYTDPTFTACNAVSPVGVLTVYVVYEFHDGARGVRYAITEDSGGALVHIADVNNFTLVTGDSQTGIDISFDGCLEGPIHVQNVLYSVESPPSTCTFIVVVPDPGAPTGRIEDTDCGNVKRFPGSSHASVDSDGSCPCGVVCCPAESGTWGRVKGLYQ